MVLLSSFASATELSVGEKAFVDLIGRDCVVVPLWPDGITPGETQPDLEEKYAFSGGKGRITNVSRASMIIVPPPPGISATGVTVMACPGGGYGNLVLPNIVMTSEWLGSMGATTVLLKYGATRRPEDRMAHRLPLREAQRAIGLLRSRAKEWGIDPTKIGVMGFSAGGHLAFNVSTDCAKRDYEAIDEHDAVSCRPDATILLYPAYLTNPHASLDADPSIRFDALDKDATPPVFMAVTRPDKFTFACVRAMLELRAAKAPAELHVYPEGGHGGLFDKYPLADFGRSCARFMKDQGFFTAEMEAAGNAWLDAEIAETKQALFPDAPTEVKSIKTNAGTLETVAEADLTLGEKLLLENVGSAKPIIRLWPGDGTGADDPLEAGPEQQGSTKGGNLRITRVTQPSMMVFRPENPDGRCVLIFPGGAYNILAAEHEGIEIAEWLNGLGVTAFLVKYRTPRRKELEKHAVALPDAQRAIRLVRSQADEFGIDPERIGVLGFSAGGHLSALTCHQGNTPSYEAVDDFDKASCAPNFGVLVYPAYTTVEKNGEEIDPMLGPVAVNNQQPLFIAIAADDSFTPGALHYFLSLQKAKTSVECHVYEKGGHGKGMRETGYPFSQWTSACERWLMDLETISSY